MESAEGSTGVRRGLISPGELPDQRCRERSSRSPSTRDRKFLWAVSFDGWKHRAFTSGSWIRVPDSPPEFLLPYQRCLLNSRL